MYFLELVYRNANRGQNMDIPDKALVKLRLSDFFNLDQPQKNNNKICTQDLFFLF